VQLVVESASARAPVAQMLSALPNSAPARSARAQSRLVLVVTTTDPARIIRLALSRDAEPPARHPISATCALAHEKTSAK
jgi:hypothetical protein